MSVIGKIIDGVISLGRFVLGDKPKPGERLDEPLGALKTEKVKDDLERARRARKHHGGK